MRAVPAFILFRRRFLVAAGCVDPNANSQQAAAPNAAPYGYPPGYAPPGIAAGWLRHRSSSVWIPTAGQPIPGARSDCALLPPASGHHAVSRAAANHSLQPSSVACAHAGARSRTRSRGIELDGRPRSVRAALPK